MKINSLILFLLIFGIGFGAGFIISGRITSKKIAEVKHRQTPAGFKEEIYKYIKPDNSQKQYLDSVIAEYIPKIKKENELSREYQKKLRDSMFSEIQIMLDKKQKTKFKKYEETITTTDKKTTPKSDTDTSIKEKRDKKKYEKFREKLSIEQQRKLDSAIERRKKDLQNPNLKREIWEYTKQNIYPILLKYRLNFDEELSESEKQTIEILIENRKKLRKEYAQSQIDDSEIEDLSDKMKEFNNEARTELIPIFLNHKNSIEKIVEDLTPYRQKWEKDISEIKAKYIEDYKPPQKKSQKIREKNIMDFLLLNTQNHKRKKRFNR